MTSNDPFVTSVSPARLVAGFTFFSGLWLFVSPWIFEAYYNADSWNDLVIGIVLGFIAAITFGTGKRFGIFRWLIGALGVWCFASPWIYGYIGNSGRFVNSLSMGVVLFVLAIVD